MSWRKKLKGNLCFLLTCFETTSLRFGYLSSSLNQRHDFIIEEVPVLQQKNGYDCGIHLICNSSHATRHIFINGHYDTLDKLSESIVKQKRSELKKLILDLGSRN